MAEDNGQPKTATALEEPPPPKTAPPAVSGGDNLSPQSGCQIKLTGRGFSLEREIQRISRTASPLSFYPVVSPNNRQQVVEAELVLLQRSVTNPFASI